MFKTFPKIVIQKTVEATSDLIANEIDDIITRFSKTSQHINLETNQEILKEKSPELWQKLLII